MSNDLAVRTSSRADALELLDDAVAGLGGERREGQQELARAVAEAMEIGHHLVAEAPTGSGKSLAYLAPAVASGLKVVVATSTIALQSQLVNKDLPALAEHGDVPFTFALLKGRSNYICRAKLRAAARPDALFEQPVVGAFSTQLGHLEAFAEGVEDGRPGRGRRRHRRLVVGGGELHGHGVPGPQQLLRRRRLLRRARPGALPRRRHPGREPRAVLRAPVVARQRAARARPRHPRRGPRLRRQRHQRVRRRSLARRPRPPLGHARPRRASSPSWSTRSPTRPSTSTTSWRVARAGSTFRATSNSSGALLSAAERLTAANAKLGKADTDAAKRASQLATARLDVLRRLADPAAEDVVWIEKVRNSHRHPRRAGRGGRSRRRVPARRPAGDRGVGDARRRAAVPRLRLRDGLRPRRRAGRVGRAERRRRVATPRPAAATSRCRHRRRSTGRSRAFSTWARTCPIPAAPATRGSSRPATACAGS